jgi:SNF2 family DNA or RNA helicase
VVERAAMTKYVPRTKPFPHQSRATLRAARNRNHAIFFEPRLGKTKAALDYVGMLALAGRVKRVLVVCPAIARDVWDQQLIEHYPYDYYAEDYTTRWENLHKMKPNVTIPWAVTRFFIAGREETFRRTRDKRTKKYLRPKQAIIEAWDPDVVIFDESHEAQRPGGVFAQDAWRLVERLRTRRARQQHTNHDKPQPWVLLLSGTPNPKGWRPLFSQFRIMDSTLWGTRIVDWDERHVVYGHGKQRWTILRYNDEARLEQTLRENASTCSADEAGLANQVFLQKLTYSMPPAAARMYDDMVEEFVAEHEEGTLTAKNAGVKRLRLLQILGGYTTDGVQLHSGGLEALRAYTRLLHAQGESVVVYARFSAEVEAITALLDDVGYRAYRVDGSVSHADRRPALAALRTRPSQPTAISAQVQALSQAVELVGAAEVVYYGIPDGWTQYFQTSRRVMGPNQKRPVRLSFLYVPGSVHAVQLRSLSRKEDWHSTLMKNPRRYLRMIQ